MISGILNQFVGNKVKVRISEWVFQLVSIEWQLIPTEGIESGKK